MKALALKYRPKNYDELVGQETVSKSLKFALDNDKIAHAYLFSGLRGSGKTSSARIFAKCLNCEKGVSSNPCGVCDSCKGNSFDIIEMDAASNRKLEDIQNLIEQTKYAPNTRFKIFIIDEVHMLTREAFNALLKTLEEPPSYVKFILATTDPLKIPPTILSRTQHFRFFKIPESKIISHLEFILNNEKVPYEKEALKMIARSGGGSLRDTLTLLDQGIIYSGGNINANSISSMLGLLDISKIDEFFNIILHKDKDELLGFLESIKTYEISRVIDDMCAYLKDRFFEKDHRFNMLILERFMGILARAKNMLSICDDEEFVLCVMSFMLKEATDVYEIDEVIEENTKKIEDKQEKSIDEFMEFKKLVFARDYELGACLQKHFEFVSLESGVFTLDANPDNDEDKALIKSKYKLLKQMVKELFNAELKIIATKLTAAKEVKEEPKHSTTEDTTQKDFSNLSIDERKKQAQNILNDVKANYSVNEPTAKEISKPILQELKQEVPQQAPQTNEISQSITETSDEERFFVVLNALDDISFEVAEVYGEHIEFDRVENNTLYLFTTADDEYSQGIIKSNYEKFKDICKRVFKVEKINVKKKLI